MKRQLLSCLFFFSAFQFASAQPNPGDVTVSIKSGALNLGKKNDIAKEWALRPALNYLGDPTRARDGYNKTHTYDEMGIVLFEKMENKNPSGKISEFQIHFSTAEPNEVTPKGGFTGKLAIEKLTVTASTDFETVKKKLKGYSETDSYIEHSHRLAKNGIYFYFQYDKSDTRLVKVSMGPDKTTKK